jgi:hypothetical protein
MENLERYKMKFDCKNVKNHLDKSGVVFTVRGYDMKNKNVTVEGVGECKREKIKEIKRAVDLIEYVNQSGFLSVLTWWLQIGAFTAEGKKYLYRVEKMGVIE